MASAATAVAVAANAAGAVVSNPLSCAQTSVHHKPHFVQFPRRTSPSFALIGAVRLRHSARTFCATQSAPAKEVDQEEEKELDNGTPEASSTETPTPTLAEVLLQNYADSLASGDEESLASVKVQLQAIVEERDLLYEQVQALKVELDSVKDRFLRLNADFENFRRRSMQEKSALSESAKGEIIESLLPMIDNFERAKGALKVETEGEGRIDSSYQGIYKQFVEIMRGFGVSVVETVGKSFDPEIHEAIMREESDQYAEGVVSQEFRRGFKLGDKLLRPAMVKVSSGPATSTLPSTTESPATSEAESPATPEAESESV